jgi:hypothetical protein
MATNHLPGFGDSLSELAGKLGAKYSRQERRDPEAPRSSRAFRSLSSDFADQLNKLADTLKEKQIKEAQMAPVAPSDPNGDPKEQMIAETLSSIQQFNERLVKEWLHSVEDSDVQEVKRVFDEINQLSAGEVQQLMGMGHSTPFDLIGSMFKNDPAQDQHGDGCGCKGDAEIPTEVVIDADDGMANSHQPEGMGQGIA